MFHFRDVLANKYADFGGRARRREFWLFYLWLWISYACILTAGSIVDAMLGTELLAPFGLLAAMLFFFVPCVALNVRRLHDVGYSGWLLLLAFVPLANVALLIMYCLDSQPGTNQYGPSPKGLAMDAARAVSV